MRRKGRQPRKRSRRLRARRTYAQLFLDKLTELAEGNQQLIGNKTLREELEWDEDRYKRVRAELAEQNRSLLAVAKVGVLASRVLREQRGLLFSYPIHILTRV